MRILYVVTLTQIFNLPKKIVIYKRSFIALRFDCSFAPVLFSLFNWWRPLALCCCNRSRRGHDPVTLCFLQLASRSDFVIERESRFAHAQAIWSVRYVCLRPVNNDRRCFHRELAQRVLLELERFARATTLINENCLPVIVSFPRFKIFPVHRLTNDSKLIMKRYMEVWFQDAPKSFVITLEHKLQTERCVLSQRWR